MSQKLLLISAIVGFILLFVLAGFAYNSLKEQQKPENQLGFASSQSVLLELNTEGQKAPDFTMTDWDGNSVKLSDMEGKPVVLNFWASWCPPCKEEMPDFDLVYKELVDEIQFMMVDVIDGLRETKEKGTRYIQEEGYTFPVFFDEKREGAMAFGIRYIPTTLFIDKEGYVIAQAQGAINEVTLRSGIDMINY